ncbi:MAG TPA: hypothetical protein VKG78_00375 [Opitutaceae bacterium]|nr:hypothetical protein [Opitutaceae bacterium]
MHAEKVITGPLSVKAPRPSTGHISLRGDFWIKITILVVLVFLLLGLLFVGVAILYKKPDDFAGYIHSIIPLFFGVIFGAIGFVVGQKTKDL